jgi:hypothetical protein
VTGAEAADFRALAVALRDRASSALDAADRVDERLAREGWPTSTAVAEVIDFPGGRVNEPFTRRDAHGVDAPVFELAARRAGGVR